jgi:hypothetical protein
VHGYEYDLASLLLCRSRCQPSLNGRSCRASQQAPRSCQPSRCTHVPCAGRSCLPPLPPVALSPERCSMLLGMMATHLRGRFGSSSRFWTSAESATQGLARSGSWWTASEIPARASRTLPPAERQQTLTPAGLLLVWHALSGQLAAAKCHVPVYVLRFPFPQVSALVECICSGCADCMG